MNKTHILRTIKPKDKEFNREEAKNACCDWLINTLAAKKCYSPIDFCETKCSFLKFLSQEGHRTTAENVANYMVDWVSLPSSEKKEMINWWARLSSIGRKKTRENSFFPNAQHQRITKAAVS